MGTILVHTDAVHILCINITGDVVTLLHHQAGLPRFLGLICKNCAVQTGSHYQVIVSHPYPSLFPKLLQRIIILILQYNSFIGEMLVV